MPEKTVKTRKKKVVDPFAEKAETTAAPMAPVRAIKVIKKTGEVVIPGPVAEAAPPPATKKPSLAADAFAELAPVSSPVKKTRVTKPKSEVPVPVDPKSVKKRAKKAAALEEVSAIAKPKRVRKAPVRSKKSEDAPLIDSAVLESKPEVSPVFKALADVSLPPLEKEDRARLMLQSPTSLYFYWSIRDNPYQLLKKAFGTDIDSYTLVLKLVDLGDESEVIFPADPAGDWWFTVEPDHEYRAEIGFYATNRPYFRIVYSNTIETPRRSPSPHPASEARWTVSANKFAEVLDVSGFTRDAIDVAIAGDEPERTVDVSHRAFAHLIGSLENQTRGIADEDVRYALLSFAAGATLEDMRYRVSPRLFAVLQANAERLTSANAQGAIGEYFETDSSEWTVDETQPVFGASLIHFPRRLKERALRPVSS